LLVARPAGLGGRLTARSEALRCIGTEGSAAGLAQELKKTYGPDTVTELIEDKGGVFEVELDGKLLFSKKKSNRFPNEGEILKLVSTL